MRADRKNGKANRLQWLWGVAFLALVACGGGSSGGGGTPEPQDPPPPTDEDPGDSDDQDDSDDDQDDSGDDQDDSGDDSSDDDDTNDDSSDDDSSNDDDSGDSTDDGSSDDDTGDDNTDDGSNDDGSNDDGSGDDGSNDDDSSDDGSNDDGSNDDDSGDDEPTGNQAPSVSAESDPPIYEDDAVTLTATASDSDGDIVSYEWDQVAGDDVTFEGGSGTTDTLNFTAPSVSDENIDLEFSVTVTDDDGDTATDTVQVTVLAEETPILTLDFPTPVAVDEDTLQQIDVFGRAEARGDIALDRVVVNAGEGERVDDTITDGRWRVEDLPLPASGDVTIEVTVFNEAGHSNTVDSRLYRDQTGLGEGPIWDESPGLVLDPDGDRFYLLTYGGEPGIKLMEVDRETGNREHSITDFFDAEQGPEYTAFYDMVLDADNNRFLLAVSQEEGDKLVLAVDRDTGQRTEYSGPERGSGPALNNPQDLYLDSEGQLWVSDNSKPENPSGAFRIDGSGDRERLFEEPYLLSSVLDSGENRLLTVRLESNNPDMKAWALNENPPTESSFSSGSPALDMGADSLHIDSANNRLLLRGRDTDVLMAIDLDSGERKELATGVLGMDAPATNEFNATETAYDPVRRVFYAAGGENRDGLVAVDPVSGDRVVISR